MSGEIFDGSAPVKGGLVDEALKRVYYYSPTSIPRLVCFLGQSALFGKIYCEFCTVHIFSLPFLNHTMLSFA